jgi:TRAP-type C4-dicarboxylate transport system substrate-binding protein
MLAAMGLGTQPAAAQTINLKASDYNPPDNYITNEMERWAKELKDKTGGHLSIEVFPSSQMGPVPRQYDLARTGVADIAFVLLGSTPGRFPLSDLSQLPGLFRTAYVASAALMDTYPEFLTKEYAGVKVLWLFAGPPLPVLTRKPLHALSEARGLRIRQPDAIHALLIDAIGAAPVGVQPGDVSDALNKGTIDGVIMGYSGVTAFQLQSVARYSTEWNTGIVAFAMVMNQDSYDKLPPDIRKIVDDTAGLTGAKRMGYLFDVDNAAQRVRTGAAGVQFIDATQEDAKTIAALGDKIAEQAVAALEAKGLPGKAFLAKLKERRDAHANDPKPDLP